MNLVKIKLLKNLKKDWRIKNHDNRKHRLLFRRRNKNDKSTRRKLSCRCWSLLHRPQNHEKEVAAINEFNSAYENLKTIMCEKCRTADGHCFTFQTFHTYYYVTYGHRPWVFQLSFSGHNINIEEDNGLQVGTTRYEDGKTIYKFYKISDLFYDEKEAIKELIKRKKENIGYINDDIKEHEKRIKNM